MRIRVGDYKFDNTNAFFSGQLRMGVLPLDDDYFALRTGLWLSSDQVYKRATDELTGKKNILRDTPESGACARLRAAAADFPPRRKCHRSRAWTNRNGQARWPVCPDVVHPIRTCLPQASRRGGSSQPRATSTRKEPSPGWRISSPISRLADGYSLPKKAIQLHDAILLTLPRLSDLPDETEIARQVDQLATELEDLRRAPQAEDYSGPVLFEAPAAAGMFAAALFEALSLPRKPVAPA